MPDNVKTVFVDQEVAPQVLSIIDEARKYVIMVTPYLGLWGHVRYAIERALKRNVEIKFFLRSDFEVLGGDDVQWLSAKGVEIQTVERLHAKIFLNEQNILVTSMNLVSSSSQNSLEVGIVITDPREQQILRHYVSESLQAMSIPIGDLIQSQTPKYSASNRAYSIGTMAGHCIRCGRPVELDMNRPLCEVCYDEWAEWQNADYPERICHICGEPSAVSYARPLCAICYHQTFR